MTSFRRKPLSIVIAQETCDYSDSGFNRKTAYCDLCGGKLAKGKTSLDIRHKGDLVIVKNIPTDVCQQCGEAYLSAETSEKIDEFLITRHICRPERYIPIPEFSAAFVIV